MLLPFLSVCLVPQGSPSSADEDPFVKRKHIVFFLKCLRPTVHSCNPSTIPCVARWVPHGQLLVLVSRKAFGWLACAVLMFTMHPDLFPSGMFFFSDTAVGIDPNHESLIKTSSSTLTLPHICVLCQLSWTILMQQGVVTRFTKFSCFLSNASARDLCVSTHNAILVSAQHTVFSSVPKSSGFR